ncbi:MAG: site-2 protease family protein [Phycisphaerales bacterium]|nr:site-2 protease family protein [Phycisphaerales bacterium]
MPSLLNGLSQFGDFLLVVLGFSLIIVIHELGHFVAARWARIRVLAFAVGFGPALISYRRGLGLRRGSSEAEFKRLAPTGLHPRLGTTEYRLNALPFGGYVKMLGQDDANPALRSDEPDSYQNCKTWKRMVVISAGVTANLVTAAILFVVVFMLGLRTEPARIGMIEPGSPAATTMATNAGTLGVKAPGLHPGDTVVAIDGETPLSFNDVMLAPMIARKGRSLAIDIQRKDVPGVLHFEIVPKVEPIQKIQQIGVGPASSNRLREIPDLAGQTLFAREMQEIGLEGLEPGMSLVAVDGEPTNSLYTLSEAIDAADGRAVGARFRSDTGKEIGVSVPARPRLQSDMVMIGDRASPIEHVLGLLPVMSVEDVVQDSNAERAGLKPGDVFVQIGAIEWPSIPIGVKEVRSHKGQKVRVIVARRDETGGWKEVELGEVRVGPQGHIGFNLGNSAELGAWVAGSPADGIAGASSSLPRLAPGSKIVEVNGQPTRTLAEVRTQLAAAADQKEVQLTVELPLAGTTPKPTEKVVWNLTAQDKQVLAVSAWQPAIGSNLFEPEQYRLKAQGPAGALAMGLRETKRVMITTYLTLARLFQGSVKVEHLRGPVGIAQVGTILADRGLVWLLFFMALISVNLAVVNFLPIPIADGGHFVFLLYEQITGRPVSVAVQNIASIAGLLLLATMFLIVTYHDIVRLFMG